MVGRYVLIKPRRKSSCELLSGETADCSAHLSALLGLPRTCCVGSPEEPSAHDSTKLPPSLEDTCFHGANGRAQNLSRFLGGSFFDVAKQDRTSNLWLQVTDRCSQELRALAPPAGLFGIGTLVSEC